ncbi:MAG: hypothetical protein U0136_16060 [Bdellovibrionota bacterium]
MKRLYWAAFAAGFFLVSPAYGQAIIATPGGAVAPIPVPTQGTVPAAGPATPTPVPTASGAPVPAQATCEGIPPNDALHFVGRGELYVLSETPVSTWSRLSPSSGVWYYSLNHLSGDSSNQESVSEAFDMQDRWSCIQGSWVRTSVVFDGSQLREHVDETCQTPTTEIAQTHGSLSFGSNPNCPSADVTENHRCIGSCPELESSATCLGSSQVDSAYQLKGSAETERRMGSGNYLATYDTEVEGEAKTIDAHRFADYDRSSSKIVECPFGNAERNLSSTTHLWTNDQLVDAAKPEFPLTRESFEETSHETALLNGVPGTETVAMGRLQQSFFYPSNQPGELENERYHGDFTDWIAGSSFEVYRIEEYGRHPNTPSGGSYLQSLVVNAGTAGSASFSFSPSGAILNPQPEKAHLYQQIRGVANWLQLPNQGSWPTLPQ